MGTRLITGLATAAAALVLGAQAGAAWGDNQFTLDAKPDSFGAVVTDAAGNGYVTWEHEASGGTDVPMFCKLAAGATACKSPIALALPDPQDGAEASALAPFAILGPAGTVWVVASRYVMDDTLVWTSTDGGATFAGPHQIPHIVLCPNGGQTCPEQSYSYSNKTDVDDVLPVTPGYQTYGGQTYLSGGVPSVNWLVGAHNPGLGFSLDNTAEAVGGPAGASEFEFSNPGSGGVAGGTLGTTSTGDVVAVYWNLTSPTPTLDYYTFNAPNPNPISPQTGWSGPTALGAGDVPRLADGNAGLFLLSADSKTPTAQATLIDVRQYNPSSHGFGAPHTLGSFPTGAGTLFSGGGLAENYTTGELAVAWPNFGELGGAMTLYLSRDGGAHYTTAAPVAKIAPGYADEDNARIAIDPAGTGWLTFVDSTGLQVADLFAAGGEYRKLKVKNGAIQIPVTCPAPKGLCSVTASITHSGTGLLAKATGNVTAATSKTLGAELNSASKAVIKKAGGKPKVSLTLRIAVPGVPAHTETFAARLVS